jgi:adenylate cyclase, class 2
VTSCGDAAGRRVLFSLSDLEALSAEPSFEREIKLRFPSAAAALAAVTALGATVVRARRLQDDVLLDDERGTLQGRGCALRVRRDGEASAAVTWKGPVVPGEMKLREEIETGVGSADALLRVLGEIGFTPRFRYQKYRTEFHLPDLANLVVAIDETPIGVFVELEGGEAAIADVAGRLGQTRSDYVLASYRSLFLDARRDGDMVFDRP